MGVAISGGARCDSLIVEGPRAPVSSEPERDWHPRIVVLLINAEQADWAAICVGFPTDRSDRMKRCWGGSSQTSRSPIVLYMTPSFNGVDGRALLSCARTYKFSKSMGSHVSSRR